MDTDYRWRQSEVTTWRQQSIAPKKLCQLQRHKDLITLVFIPSSLRRLADGDIIITRTSFEHLEAAPTATAILTIPTQDECALIPRGAIEFDDAKKAFYRSQNFREEEAPTLGDCLKVGFRAQDMVVGPDGRAVMPGQAPMHAHKAGDISDAHPEV